MLHGVLALLQALAGVSDGWGGAFPLFYHKLLTVYYSVLYQKLSNSSVMTMFSRLYSFPLHQFID